MLNILIDFEKFGVVELFRFDTPLRPDAPVADQMFLPAYSSTWR